MRSFLGYWLPLAIWAVVILNASGASFDAKHTGSMIDRIFAAIGVPLGYEASEVINVAVRKLAHVTEYGILGALAFRAARGERRGWIVRWAIAAVLIAAAVASMDELLQSFTPTRTALPADVLLDATGAALAQVIVKHLVRPE